MFSGFENPKDNYSKLPHEFIEQLPKMDTAGEVKVVLYILRHTWGFQDDDKRITLDEFQLGRKKRDGSRLDSGVGMSRNSIRLGLKKAILHGFIRREADGKDRARQSFYYSLVVRNEPTDGQKLTIRGSETDNRTEKDTKKKNKRNYKPHFSQNLSAEAQKEIRLRERRERELAEERRLAESAAA